MRKSDDRTLGAYGLGGTESRKGQHRGRREDMTSAGLASLKKLGLSAFQKLTALPPSNRGCTVMPSRRQKQNEKEKR